MGRNRVKELPKEKTKKKQSTKSILYSCKIIIENIYFFKVHFIIFSLYENNHPEKIGTLLHFIVIFLFVKFRYFEY